MMAIDKQFLVKLGDKLYPTYPGILAEAHDRGLISIETQIVQIPAEENGNTAIVKAVVTMRGGGPTDRQTFEGYGDSSPRNVNPRIATALLRMAETRAKGRALRDAINCGDTMLEELPGDNADEPTNGHATPHAAARARAAAPGSTVGKGFEPTYGQAGTRQYTRAELIQRAGETVEQAMALGMKLKPLDLEHATNEALFQLTEKIQERIQSAVTAQQAEAEEGKAVVSG